MVKNITFKILEIYLFQTNCVTHLLEILPQKKKPLVYEKLFAV